MSYYNSCLHCGARLGPGKRCGCIESLRAEALKLVMQLTEEDFEELFRGYVPKYEKGAAADGNDIDSGRAEQVANAVSASSIAER